MKIVIKGIVILCICYQGFSKGLRNEMDTIPSPTVSGKVEIANIGLAPIPAFSFDKPLATGFLSVKKKRFSYDTDFAVGLNGNPWMINNWFGIKIINRKKFILKAGVNPSLFFNTVRTDAGEKIIQTQRNFSFEFTGEYKPAQKWAINFSYMQNIACDVGALSGNFSDVSAMVSPILLSQAIYLTVRQQLFYFDFKNFEGLFTSTNIRIYHDCVPISIFFQGVLPLWSSFPGNGFKWNTGIAYLF